MLSDLAQVIAFCSSNCPSLPKYLLKRFPKWRPCVSILTFEGNGTMFRGISSVGTCKTICCYVLFILRPEKYNFSKFRKYSRQGTWLARTWQLHSQCLLTAMRRPRSSSAQNRLTCRASVSKDVDWSPQMKKKNVSTVHSISLSLFISRLPQLERLSQKQLLLVRVTIKKWVL